MKILKLFLLIFSFTTQISCAQGTTDLEVGISESGKFTITSPLTSLKEEWGEMLSAQGAPAELRNFAIRQGTDLSTKKDYYMLVAKSADGKTKVATLLTLTEGKFFYQPSPSGTVTCTGCYWGCDPDRFGDYWYCNLGECKKTDCKKTATVKTKDP